MSGDPSALAAWSFGLAAVVYAALALGLVFFGYLRAPRAAREIAAVAAIACSAAWGGFGLWSELTGHPALDFLADVADVLRYGLWFAFLLLLFKPESGASASGGLIQLAPLAAAVVAGAVLARILFFADVQAFGDLARAGLFMSLSLAVLGLILLEQVYRNVPKDARWNAKPLCLGLGAAFLFDLYVYSQAVLFNRLDADAFNVRGIVHSLVAPLLLLSFTRRKSWMSQMRLSQKAAFHSAVLLLAGVYLIFTSAVGYYVRFFGGEWGRAAQVALMFSALVLLVLLAVSGAMRAKLRVYLVKHFYSYRYDYREEWLKFTQTLSAADSPQQTGQNAIRGLAHMVESPGGALWMKSGGEATISEIARWNMPPQAEKEHISSPLCRFLASSGWVVNLGEYRTLPERYGDLVLPKWLMNTPNAWLLVPLLVGDQLIGFVLLMSARTEIDVNWEINDLLKTAGRQAASFLAQMQATEALLEVRKFDAFNRMSAFVVHDLKNIVTQLSLMMKNAQRLRDNPEFQEDMLMTVENALDRMRQLMLQLREGATPVGTTVGVDLPAIVRRIEAVARGRGRSVDVQVLDSIGTRGQEERLERVLGHVVQNAIDATDPPGRVWVRLERQSGQACIEIGDTGKGMSEEFIRERLFKPFQTTKESGMGIGAYESFQYVRELGGEIGVVSELGKGTVVTVRLPLFEVKRESDLQMLEVP
ncbi:MAG: XrtA/PEP-CTERM system histidine kinase PrsK [Burkholderiales bacterium]